MSFPNTTFVPKSTIITSTWLQAVNDRLTPVVDVNGIVTKPELAASSGSSLVGYMPGGVGAVATTAAQIFSETVSVLRFMSPAQILAVTSRDGVTDVSAALIAAANYAVLSGASGKGIKITLPAGLFMIGAGFSLPNGTVLEGAGRQQTVIRALPGFVGVMVTDRGNASKIFIKHMRIEAFGVSGVTDIIKLGYGGIGPFAQCELYDLYIAGGIPPATLAGCKGLNLVGNVASCTEIEVGGCESSFYEGVGSTTIMYNRCFSINAQAYAFKLGAGSDINDCEIEAPGHACVGVAVLRVAHINGLTYSQSNSGVVNPYAIEVDAAATLLSINGFIHYDGGGASALTHVVKDNRAAYPQYWGDGVFVNKSQAFIGDSAHIGRNLYMKDCVRQSFKLRLINEAGTLKHQIYSQGNMDAASAYVGKIANATTALATLPIGADATTAMNAGAKLSTVYINALFLDTVDQLSLGFSCMAIMSYNSTGTALNVQGVPISQNINGVTKTRLALFFYNAATGANFDIGAIAASASFVVSVEGFLS